MTLRAALVDVGGTLWPDRWPSSPGDRAEQTARLRRVVRGLSEHDAKVLIETLDEAAAGIGDRLALDVDQLVATAARRARVDTRTAAPAAIRRAMCLPASTRVGLFPHAAGLLAELKQGGLRVVAITNAVWRDRAAYRRDLDELGVGGLVDAIVSSVEVGARKPHPAVFRAAIAAAGCAATACVMIGNSESADIRPAAALGMRTLRVAIEEPLPASTVADAHTDSLLDAARLLHTWIAGGHGG
jgi:putative hydrolase of the HAD superfamily